MKVVRMHNRRLPEYSLLLIALILSSSICFFTKPTEAQAEAATIKIINPLSGDNKFNFSSNEHPVNSTFTVNLTLTNVTQMSGWQVFIEWNNTVINFLNGSIPENNIFHSAVYPVGDASLINPKPSVDNETGDTSSVSYGAAINPLLPAVDVPGEALLCEFTFTIVAAPPDGSQIYTNLNLIGRRGEVGTSLDSFVQVPYMAADGYPRIKNVLIFAEPAIVRISSPTSNFSVIRDIAIRSLSVNPAAVQVGDAPQIVIEIQNVGNDLEMFNVTIEKNQTEFVKFRQVLAAFENVTYRYIWNSSDTLLDVPVKVTVFGIPIVVAHQTHVLFSADLALPGDMNQTNNRAEVDVIIGEKFDGLGYWSWLALVWLGTPLGQLLLAYTIIFAGILLTLSLNRRLRSPKLPPLPKTQTTKEPANAST